MSAPTKLADVELLLDYLDGQLDPQAEQLLHARLKAEPELAQELVRLSRVEGTLREWSQAMLLADTASDLNEPEPTPVPVPRRAAVPWVWLAGGTLLAALLFLALSTGLWSPPASRDLPHPDTLARLLEAVGQVELQQPTGERSLGQIQQTLMPGLTLHVRGHGSRARVEYPDGTRLDLTSDTSVRLEGGASGHSKQVILMDGYVYAEVQPQPEDRPLVLTTPHVIIRSPGTRFSSSTQRDATRIELEEGRLQVTRSSDGQSIDVTEGLYAIIARDEPALMPEPLPPRISQHRDLIKHGTGPILSIAFSPKSNLLAVGGHDGTLMLWDAETRRPWRQWKAHPARVKDIAWLPDARSILTVGQDKQVKLWDPFTGEVKMPLIKLRKEAETLALSPDGKKVAIALAMGKGGPNNEQVRIFDLTTGQEIGKLVGHNQNITSLAFLPDGETLVTAGKDNLVKLWSVEKQTELATLPGHLGWVNTVACDPDGRTLASGGRDGTIKLWDVGTRTEIRTLPGHPREVRCLAFSPDGRVLASCGTDGAARLWDMHSGQELMHLTGLNYASPSIAFSHDGQFLGVSSWDPQVKVWEMPAGLRPRKPGL